ncbi:MAG: NAD(P)-dependent oxidoreductase [Defluviitaleaceae bacterium]|nr:NAD(P)-dependent oxidoreductase [Defluviitaleaceae bacterium]
MWTEEYLDELLTTPSAALTEDMAKVEGDIIILGAGGKMGPTLAALAVNACKKAGVNKRIIAVSRFGDPFAVALLKKIGVEIISMDMMEPGVLAQLPDVPNVIYMAGRKFGTDGQEHLTWAMNTWLPSLVAERFRNSRIVVFSSGNVYPMMHIRDGGADETVAPGPIGEYGMSTLGRERMFEYASVTYGTPVCMYRLNYAVDLRYGVLNDIAQNILAGNPVPIYSPVVNCIWQGDANEVALRCLHICESPASFLNVTGPETVSVKWAAIELGKHLGIEPIIEEQDNVRETALLNNAAKMCKLFGYPTVSLSQMIEWQALWLKAGGRLLNKPTHFEERKGKF